MIKQRKPFRHLNQSDRDRIEALLRANHKKSEIAKILGFAPGTISREIDNRKRTNGLYSATTAQQKASVRRSNSKYQGMKIEKYPELRKFIILELKNKRSPDEIAGRLKMEGSSIRVGTKAIYKWLYSCWGQAYCKYLCTKRYKKRVQKKKTKREMIPDRIPLNLRPIEGEHGEGDLFVSPTKLGTSRSGAIFCVPSAKFLVGRMIENRKPATMVQAVHEILLTITINDLTFDNGMENRNHRQFGINTYFADPHSPTQKPHIENSIGLIRRWFIKKKTDLRTVSEEDYQKYIDILNGKYRKSLGYRSAYEVAFERGIIQKIPAKSGI
jgi:IS30 family transposase